MSETSRPLVSIIIPTHDRWLMLGYLLQSIPDRKDLEVIVVDDHSTEARTPDLKHKMTNFRILRAPNGQRFAGCARNQGMAAAHGEFLFFADSDDLLCTEAFCATMEQLPGAQEDVLCCLVTSFVDGSNETGTRHIASNWLVREYRKSGNPDSLFRRHMPIGKFVRRAFCERHGLMYGESRVSNDVLFNIELNAAGPCTGVIDRVVYAIRQGNPSLTSTMSLDSIRERLDVLSVYNARLREIGKGYLRGSAAGYILKALREYPASAPELALRAIRSGTPIIPPIWTLRNAIRRKILDRIA